MARMFYHGNRIKLEQGVIMLCFQMFIFCFHYVYVCVFVCMHMCADAHQGQKGESDPLVRGTGI